jgi:hypothetical protein
VTCVWQAQISDLFTAAFKEPIVSSKMIGFRFTVGGGKKVRQKYGDDMPKYCRCPPTCNDRVSSLPVPPSPALRCPINEICSLYRMGRRKEWYR